MQLIRRGTPSRSLQKREMVRLFSAGESTRMMEAELDKVRLCFFVFVVPRCCVDRSIWVPPEWLVSACLLSKKVRIARCICFYPDGLTFLLCTVRNNGAHPPKHIVMLGVC